MENNILKVNAIKVNEDDKFIITIGNYIASSAKFDSREEAEEYIEAVCNSDQQQLIASIATAAAEVVYNHMLNKNKEEE